MGTTISKRNLSLAPIDDVLNKIGLKVSDVVQYPRKFNDGYWLFCLTHSEIGIYPLVIKWGYDEREIWWKEFGIESGIYPTIKNPDYLQKAYKALKDLNLLNAWACEWFHKCGYVSEEQLNLF